jgi:hypothetical protein
VHSGQGLLFRALRIPHRPSEFHDNDLELTARLLEDPALARRNSVTVDWDDAWTLEKATLGASEANVVEISVRFTLRIPVKVTALLSVGLDVSRSEVRRLVANGSLSSAHCLTGTASGDFSFVFRRSR